jgi:uncharacterized membrane-anchored protein YhcB (DUF1043 family)
MTCERCGTMANDYLELFDYCADCSKNLCPDCMAKGCCGNVPAVSGTEADQPTAEEMKESWKRAKRRKGIA